ncbi:hypothetical protein FRB96_003558 [Tulasnella sp. 330]|nr:hypothetical protein FRB96_003558 [Tulasnella sp. 330]
MSFLWALLGTLVLALAAASTPTPTGHGPRARRQQALVPDLGFYDPHLNDGGYMLTNAYNEQPNDYGEPLNVIISAHSDPAVLVDQETSGGLRNYFQSLGFSTECLGASEGTQQSANLGDGRGYVNQTAVIRWDYGSPSIGTCEETLLGGDHFRYWSQIGMEADSGAYFLAASYESALAEGHNIIKNGYNLGRDWLVGNATQHTFPDPNPLDYAQPTSTSASSAASSTPTLDSNGATGIVISVPNGQFTGTTSANGYTYQTVATYVSGLLANSSVGVNHNDTVSENGEPAQDGLVAVLVVTITNSTRNYDKSKLWDVQIVPSAVKIVGAGNPRNLGRPAPVIDTWDSGEI